MVQTVGGGSPPELSSFHAYA
eukprot:SAG31_NODE_11075_length_1069_cov_0.990722_1_plen_20_part_10